MSGLVSKLTAERSHLQHEVTRLTAEVYALESDRNDLLENASGNIIANNNNNSSNLVISLETPDVGSKATTPNSAKLNRLGLGGEVQSSPVESLLKERLRRGEQRLQQVQLKVS